MKTDFLAGGAARNGEAQPTDLGVIRPVEGAWEAVIEEKEVPLLKAMVIDPQKSGRISATHALMAFEPGFDVVSVANVEAAAEWLETFVPDLLVVSAALERSAAAQLVASVLAVPGGSSCRLISIGNVGDLDALAGHGWHDALHTGIGLAQWLQAVRQVFRQEDLSSSQPA